MGLVTQIEWDGTEWKMAEKSLLGTGLCSDITGGTQGMYQVNGLVVSDARGGHSADVA
jgi:hypothetical protein